jgi:hypothetical protein
MSEWVRLTPPGDNVSYYNGVRVLSPTADMLAYELYSRWLTSDAALAFARQLPEVRALVYAVQVLRSWLHDETQVKLETPGLAESRNGANFFDDLDHALAPFQETNDGG